MSAGVRTERLAIAVLAAATLATATWWLATAGWRHAIVGVQFPMVELWRDARKSLPASLAASLPMLVLLDVLLAAGLALVLCLSRSAQAHARLLRRALAAGASSALYLFVLRALPGPPAAWMAPLDMCAFVLGALAIADLVAFLTSYPRTPDPTTIRAYWRKQGDIRPDGLIGRLRWGLIRGAQATLRAAGAPASMTDLGSEDSLARHVANSLRTLDFLASTKVRIALLAAGLLDGLLFAFGSDDRATGLVVLLLTTAAPFLTILGSHGLEINYHCGDDDDRRRIGWIWLGPALGFIVASVFFWLTMLGAVFFHGPHGEPARWFGIDVWLLFLSSLFLFVPLTIGAFLLGLAFSIFYNGAIDPRLTIRRGALIGFGGIVFSGLFVGFESLIQSQVVLHLGLSAQTNAMAAGVLAAVVFAPLRKRIERGVGRTVERLMPVNALADGERATVSVCFIDMSGYTALSERDQPGALLHAALLQKCGRNAAQHAGGQLIKSLGDAVMLRFPTPQAAIAAAVALRRDYAAGAATLGVAPLPLHGGLHHGEVVAARDGDLYGAAVNLASRLCAAAGDGQMVVSEATRALLPATGAQALGELRLKNVHDPVPACALNW